MTFDPNTEADKNLNIFGLPCTVENAKLVYIPVPWDITTSYQKGTANAPKAIFNASFQVDLFDTFKKNAWKTGYAMCKIPFFNFNSKDINIECEKIKDWVKEESKKYLDQGKMVAVIGGEHSVSLGLMQSLAKRHKFGILQIDAHADLRECYQGFEYSHASAMYNALKMKRVKKLVQIGVRDYCQEEHNYIIKNQKRIKTFLDKDIKNILYGGGTWKNICYNIINELPKKVYISFDVDGLDPKLCPNTGTPVAGGLETEQLFYLFEMIVKSGRKIIGFDLCETGVSENEWDENVSARILYRLSNIMTKSNKL